MFVNDDPDRTGGNNTSSGITVLNSIIVGNSSANTDGLLNGVGPGQVRFPLSGIRFIRA